MNGILAAFGATSSNARRAGRSGRRKAPRLFCLLTMLFLVSSLLAPFATSATYAQDTDPAAEPIAAEPAAEQAAAEEAIVNVPVDSDGDGVEDAADICSAGNDGADADGDGTPDACDATPNGDADGDGIDNLSDSTPNGDTDGDGIDNLSDSTPNGDAEGDGIDNAVDICPAGNDGADADGDGVADACDDTPNGDAPAAPVVEEPETTTDETSSVTVEVSDDLEVVTAAPVTCAVAEGASPWIASDLDDYPPGALVTLSGGSWVPGQHVEIFVDDDGVADAQMGPWSHAATVTADGAGGIFYQFNLAPWFVNDYTVVATGECSTASTAFTDARVVTTASLNGGTTVNVAPGASIPASVTVTTDGSGANGRWNATAWLISNSAPGTVNCEDHANFAAGTKTVPLTIAAPSASGTYNVYFIAYSDDLCTTASGGGAPSVTFTMSGAVTVNKASQAALTVTGPTSGTYDEVLIPTASGGSGTGALSFTATGSACQIPTTGPNAGKLVITSGTGTCAVTATKAADANYNAATSAAASIEITQAAATLELSNLVHTYDGTGKAATVTTDPAGLSGVSITYDGEADLPVAAGSYDVEATLTNANYTAAATGTLEITQAGQTIDFSALANKTFGDPAFSVSASTSSSLAITFTAEGDCTVLANEVSIIGGGSCTVTASQAGNANYHPAEPVSRTFTIAPQLVTLALGNLTHTYDGTAKAATVTTDPADLEGVVITYRNSANVAVTAPTNAGSYAVEATLSNANYSGTTSGTLVINQASQTITFSALANKTVSDSAFSVSATATSGLAVSFAAEGDCTVSGTTVTLTGVGNCTVTASQAGDANYSAAPNVVQLFTIKDQPFTVKGFYQPIDMGGVANTAKGGSTIPVKFEVFQGTTEITDPAKIKIVVQKVSCTSNATEDVIEQIAAGSTSLRYDTTSGQFIYNWQTPKAAGTCYSITVVTSSGETIPGAPTAIIKLK